MRFQVKKVRTAALWAVPLTFLVLFYFYPLGRILSISLSRGDAGLFAPFVEALTSPSMLKIIGFTLWQATLSTILTLMLGLPGAYLLARYDFRGKSFVLALTGIPFVMPTLVVAAAFNALLGPQGLVNVALMNLFNLSQPPIEFINTFTAILIAHIFYNLTIVLRMVGDFWSHIDPRFNQAAKVLGANSRQALMQVTLPLLMPAIAAAALLVFIFDFTSFGVILVLGGPRYTTLEVEIYNQTISLFNLPLAAALSAIQLGCTLGFTVLYTRLSRRVSRPLSLRPQAITQKRLTTWQSRLFAGFILIMLVGLETVPLVALAARSFAVLSPDRGQSSPVSQRLTLAYYRELTINRRNSLFYVPPTKAISNSLTYAFTTVILALAIGLQVAWALARDRDSPINRVMDPVLMLPLGTSAVTLGLGFIVALNRPPLNLRASPVLLPLAHTLVALPFVVRSLTPAIISIRPRLRHAASVLGAPDSKVFQHIDLPMVGRALLVAAIFAFTISLGEFGATSLISRPENPTIPIMIYRFISQPGAINYGQALALSTILMLITAVGMLAIERFRFADVGEF